MYSKKEADNRAVVIGNGMAGKLAARVLSEFFDEVIVIEKDKEYEEASARKGVPQGKQGHVLLKSGEAILEEVSLACSHDEKVDAQFTRVLHLKSHPVSLAKPSLLARIFRPTIAKPRR